MFVGACSGGVCTSVKDDVRYGNGGQMIKCNLHRFSTGQGDNNALG